MSAKRVVVIGASSGGVDALRAIAANLVKSEAAICVVVHTGARSPGLLSTVLSQAGELPATTVAEPMRLDAGRIYVAPPDHHLLIEPGSVRLTKGPKENGFRPAIDPLFRSAAQVFGPGAVGVILTGCLDDGSAGLWMIKRLGGIAIVQDPGDAMYPGMPLSAAAHVDVDYTVPLRDIAPLLNRIVVAPVEEFRKQTADASFRRDWESLEIEVKIAQEAHALGAGLGRIAAPSPFSCPECHGVLLRLKDAEPLRFRCHTGHAYSEESLIAALSADAENALWAAVRSLEESALFLQHVSVHLTERGETDAAQRLVARAAAAHEQSETVRRLVMAPAALPEATVAAVSEV